MKKKKKKKKHRKGGGSFNEHYQNDLYPQSTKSRYFVPQNITIEKWERQLLQVRISLLI